MSAAPPRIPDGYYRARALAHGWDRTRGGALVFCIEWEVTRGPWSYQRLMQRMQWSENAAKWSLKKLRAAGWKGTDLATAAPSADEQTVRVSRREYEGKEQVDVEAAEPWHPYAQVPAEQIEALAGRMRGALEATAPTSDGEDGFQ